MLQVCPCSSSDVVSTICCSPLRENYTFSTSDLRLGYMTCLGQWNVNESDTYPFWGKALRAIVGSGHLSFLSSWKMVMCQIRAAPSAWILEWRKCGTGFQPGKQISGQCELIGGNSPVSCSHEMTFTMNKKSAFAVVAPESLNCLSWCNPEEADWADTISSLFPWLLCQGSRLECVLSTAFLVLTELEPLNLDLSFWLILAYSWKMCLVRDCWLCPSSLRWGNRKSRTL